MKAFVIKNKEGKYLKRGFTRFENPEKDGVFNTGHFYYENKEEAESDIVCYGLEDCKVVPVTIAEGDLEQENKQLKEQLAEKDREIDKLTRRLNLTTKYKDDQKERANKYYDEIKEIRKQVCDEIRNYIDNEIYDRFDDQDVDYLTIDLEEFEDLLQDLEQTKESIK